MPIPFQHLGVLFKLFSGNFYSRDAREHLSRFILSQEKDGVVIDLGGGTGTLLNLAHAERPDLSYLCLDASPGMLRYAPLYAWRVAGRSEGLPLSRSVAGSVMIGDALHHFEQLIPALEEIDRVLKPGGRLFVFDLDPATFIGRLVMKAEELLGEPGNFFSPGQLQRLLARIGFVVVSRSGGWRYTLEAQKPA